jgi:hypothetical protein
MEKLIKKLDELFKKYNVTEEEIAEVGEIIANVENGELVQEGEEFEAPDMGGQDGDSYEEDGNEDED